MNEFITEYGMDKIEEIVESYPNLRQFYQEFVGNFIFTVEEYREHKEDIERYIKNHKDYHLGFYEDECGGDFYALYDVNDF
ncbi:MAG: hypothetical protein RR359_05900 [Bacilli bacterium]